MFKGQISICSINVPGPYPWGGNEGYCEKMNSRRLGAIGFLTFGVLVSPFRLTSREKSGDRTTTLRWRDVGVDVGTTTTKGTASPPKKILPSPFFELNF